MAPTSGKKGFTLIELLIVIAIIGLLSTIAVISLNAARKKARMTKRMADMTQIQKALELYYDSNGAYPITADWRSQCVNWGGYAQNLVIPGLVPTYMGSFPADPLMNAAASTACFLYYSPAPGTEYKLLDHLLTDLTAADYLSQPTFVDPTRDGGGDGCALDGTAPWSWAKTSPGATNCW